MTEPSYVGEILEEFWSKSDNEPEVRENTLKRLMHGYGIIAEELSKEFEFKKYKEKGMNNA